MIPFKTRVLHSESGIFQHISANNILYITGDQTISGLKSFDRRPTFNGTGFLLSGEASSTLGGEYYLNNNPSGFITGVDTSNFYTNDNLSGFITGVDTSTLYPRSNPSGYITGVNLSSYVTNSQTGAFYPASNPSGFLTGIDTSNFYTNDNLSGYVTFATSAVIWTNSPEGANGTFIPFVGYSLNKPLYSSYLTDGTTITIQWEGTRWSADWVWSEVGGDGYYRSYSTSTADTTYPWQATSWVSSIGGTAANIVEFNLKSLPYKVSSNVTNINGATALKNMMQITQSGYNSLGVNVATGTLYIIVG